MNGHHLNSLYSIATGIVAKTNVNIDAAKIVGDRILNKMTGECVLTYSFRIPSLQ